MFTYLVQINSTIFFSHLIVLSIDLSGPIEISRFIRYIFNFKRIYSSDRIHMRVCNCFPRPSVFLSDYE